MDVDILYSKYNFKVVCLYKSFMHITTLSLCKSYFSSPALPSLYISNGTCHLLIMHSLVFSGFPYYSHCAYTIPSLFCMLSLGVAASHMNCNVVLVASLLYF